MVYVQTVTRLYNKFLHYALRRPAIHVLHASTKVVVNAVELSKVNAQSVAKLAISSTAHVFKSKAFLQTQMIRIQEVKRIPSFQLAKVIATILTVGSTFSHSLYYPLFGSFSL